ncbi:PTS transporter subunit EIIC [Mycoplasmopsis gallinacea]|uniref:PTS transporter subunit EIIC n=1 Tax=Mycoplasmopsis gallinacea TaxID=29556 RepID=A0A6H0V2X3_9BACT|nr:PTS transporter subunit EIIC [Mycoplasmopsis gallinacea]QIW62542.1 PTS transporter subunit EIIC [Mycoplasmopsis gallinacea]
MIKKVTIPDPLRTFWSKFRSGLERFGRSLILPVSILPIMAIIGAIGYIMISAGNKTGAMKDANFAAAANAIKLIGMAPIYNLDILFAIGIAAGLAKEEKASSALCGICALIGLYFAGNVLLKYSSLKSLLDPKEVGKLELIERFGKYSNSFNLNALGGILAGYIGYLTHKYTYRLQFPKAIAFFGGAKFSPVATFLTSFIIGLPFNAIWVYIYYAIGKMGQGIRLMGAGGSFLYGFTNRLLLPFGLHNVPNAILRYTPAGGTWKFIVEGKEETFNGFYTILLAKLQHGQRITAQDSMISNGTYPTNIFALPGAAVAMFLAVPKDKRKVAAPIIFGAVSSAVLSGVTEPIEFTFIFVAPVLWLVHALMTGFTYMFMYLAGAGMVSGTGEGIITWLIYNLSGYEIIDRVWMLWVLGPVFFVEYLLVFYFLITKMNLSTPGRNGNEVKLMSKKEFREKTANKDKEETQQISEQTKELLKNEKEEDINLSKELINAYGGFENMTEIGSCISRLRISVIDKDKVDRDKIKALGAMGVVESGDQVQSVFGAKAMVYSRIMNNLKK